MFARHAGRLHRGIVYVGDLAVGADGDERVRRRLDQRAGVLRCLLLFRDVARGSEYTEDVALVVPVDGGIVEHVHDPARRVADGERIVAHEAVGEHLPIASAGLVRFGEIVAKVGADELFARDAGRLHRGRVHVGDLAVGADGDERVGRRLDQRAGVLRCLLLFRDVARRGEHALQLPVTTVEGGRIVGHDGLRTIHGARGELVVGHLLLGEHSLDARLGPFRIGEAVLERCVDQLVARTAGERLHLLVDVGDDAGGIGRHQRVDVRFDERARVELLVAQPLIEQRLLLFDLLARRIVGAHQVIADDGTLIVTQRRDRDQREDAAAVLADIRQLVVVLDAARGFAHQRFEARRDRGAQFDAHRRGARDYLLRVGDLGRGARVHHVGGGIAEHALGADVENPDHALRVRGDAGEVGAEEDCVLQGARPQHRPLTVDVHLAVRFTRRSARAITISGLRGRLLRAHNHWTTSPLTIQTTRSLDAFIAKALSNNRPLVEREGIARSA